MNFVGKSEISKNILEKKKTKRKKKKNCRS